MPDDDSSLSHVRLGTCGWSYKDWTGVFYPPGTKPTEMLSHYATRFSAVEIDSTFYGVPVERTVEGWRRRVPPGFQLCPKFPQEISHTKFLVDCEAELDEFLDRMQLLGPALGPMVLQFPYYRRDRGIALHDFIDRLQPFLARFDCSRSPGMRIAVEVRNKGFWASPLLDLLRRYEAALVVLDHPYMPAPEELPRDDSLFTTDFTYLRLLGDRYAIERITHTWERAVLDTAPRLDRWGEWIRAAASERRVWVFANNHYAGHAPTTMAELRRRIADPDHGLRFFDHSRGT